MGRLGGVPAAAVALRSKRIVTRTDQTPRKTSGPAGPFPAATARLANPEGHWPASPFSYGRPGWGAPGHGTKATPEGLSLRKVPKEHLIPSR